MTEKNSEKFCKTFHDRIEIAQKEIKNLNSFMSTDINDGKFQDYLWNIHLYFNSFNFSLKNFSRQNKSSH